MSFLVVVLKGLSDNLVKQVAYYRDLGNIIHTCRGILAPRGAPSEAKSSFGGSIRTAMMINRYKATSDSDIEPHVNQFPFRLQQCIGLRQEKC
jgi:hypothetical protein